MIVIISILIVLILIIIVVILGIVIVIIIKRIIAKSFISSSTSLSLSPWPYAGTRSCICLIVSMFFRWDASLPVHLRIRYQPGLSGCPAQGSPRKLIMALQVWNQGYPNTNWTNWTPKKITAVPYHSIHLPHLWDRFGEFSFHYHSPHVPSLYDLRRRRLHHTQLHAVSDQLPPVAIVFHVPWKAQVVRPHGNCKGPRPMHQKHSKTVWHKEVGPGQWCPFVKMEVPVWLIIWWYLLVVCSRTHFCIKQPFVMICVLAGLEESAGSKQWWNFSNINRSQSIRLHHVRIPQSIHNQSIPTAWHWPRDAPCAF